MSDSTKTSAVINGRGMLFLFDVCNSTEIVEQYSNRDSYLFYLKIQSITDAIKLEVNRLYEKKTVICQSTGDGFYLFCEEPLLCIELWKKLTEQFRKEQLAIRCGASYGEVTTNGLSIGCPIGNVVARCCNFSKESGLCITSVLYDLIKRSNQLLSEDIDISPVENPDLKGLNEKIVYLIKHKEREDDVSFVESEKQKSQNSTEKDGNSLKWLHLSDLQFGTVTDEESEEWYRSLLHDIEKYSSNLDLIFITGGITYSGEHVQYEKAAEFFEKLLKITNVPKEHLFFIPGNHDLQRCEDEDSIIQNIQNYGSKLEAVHSEDQTKGTSSAIFSKHLVFGGNETEEVTYNKPYFRKDILLNSINITVVGFNSAGSSLSYDGRYSVLLDERSVIKAYSDINKNNIVITLLHHPVKLSYSENTKTISQIINNHSTFILHGHDHCDETGFFGTLGFSNNLTHYISAGNTRDDGYGLYFYNITSVNIAQNECKTILRGYVNDRFWNFINYGSGNSMVYRLYEKGWAKKHIDVNSKNSTIQIQPQTSIGYKTPDKKTIAVPAIPRYLLADIVAGKCVLFAGAGASADGGLPIVSELVHTLTEALKTMGHDEMEQTTQNELMHLSDCHAYEPIFHFCLEKLGPTDFTRILREMLDCEGKESLVHEVISRIPFKMIMTTNHDLFIEKYCSMSGKQYEVILPDNMNIDFDETGSSLPIIKIHGTLENPCSIKFTSHDICLQFLNNNYYKKTLSEIFTKYTVLFFGTSFSDIDIRLLLTDVFEKHKYSGKKHYALLPDVTEIEKRMFLKNYNLQVISYDSSYNHIAAYQFLEKLSEEVNNSAKQSP